jgi:hypothetical protein
MENTKSILPEAENHRKTLVNSSAYIDFAKFINKSHERRFNDALMKLIIIEIELKSFDFNENMILPRYFNKSVEYQGETYLRSAFIKDLLSKKAIIQTKDLIKKGSKTDFKNRDDLRNWICEETGINNGSLSALFE